MDWDTGLKKPDKPGLTKEERIMAEWTAEAMCLSGWEEKKAEYRASAMPICGHYTEYMKGQMVPVEGKKDFYTGVGTVIHTLLQRRFPNTRHGLRVFGNWRCRNPRCNHMMLECVNPDSCVECGSAEPLYEEVECTYRGLITMHIDLLIKLPNTELVKKRFWLNDWKTCGEFALENPQFVGMPYPKNRAQIETYCVAVKIEKGWNVEHAFLDYTLRGDPELDPKNPKNRPFGFKITREILIERKRQMDRIVAEKVAFEAWKADPTLDNLKKFDRLRPCFTAEDYADSRYGMAPHFKYHEDRKCPFANGEGCFKKGLSQPAQLLEKRRREGKL